MIKYHDALLPHSQCLKTETKKVLKKALQFYKNETFKVFFNQCAIGFLCCCAAGLIDGCFVAGGCSVDYNGPGCDESVDGEVVRAVLWPGCVVARPIPGMPKATTLQWLLDIDYKGWAPRCLLDWTVPFAQVIKNFLFLKQNLNKP